MKNQKPKITLQALSVHIQSLAVAIKDIKQTMVTKEDIKQTMVTKDEMNKFVTKADLRDELSRFVTSVELKEELSRFSTRKDLDMAVDRITNHMDGLWGESKRLDEVVLMQGQRVTDQYERLNDHERRITALEVMRSPQNYPEEIV